MLGTGAAGVLPRVGLYLHRDGSCPSSGRRNGGLNRSGRVGETQYHAVDKFCAAGGGGGRGCSDGGCKNASSTDFLGVCCWHVPGSKQVGHTGLPLQQKGLKYKEY